MTHILKSLIANSNLTWKLKKFLNPKKKTLPVQFKRKTNTQHWLDSKRSQKAWPIWLLPLKVQNHRKKKKVLEVGNIFHFLKSQKSSLKKMKNSLTFWMEKPWAILKIINYVPTNLIIKWQTLPMNRSAPFNVINSDFTLLLYFSLPFILKFFFKLNFLSNSINPS